MAGQSGQVIAVNGQDGNRVLLSVPMEGFPDGFQLRAGDRVVLVQGETGPAVRPLTRAYPVDRTDEKDGLLRTADHEFYVQAATVRSRSQDQQHMVFSVPNDRGEPEQLLSIRRP
ncbi:MAG TPA: hypothetical protein VFP80_16875 [Thermoanaerobaculia bacterium]|nr:hypothetical protein [Thermoanaerobaculia bacterium]